MKQLLLNELKAFLITFSFFSRLDVSWVIGVKTDEVFQNVFPRSIKYIPVFALISGGFLLLIHKGLTTIFSDKTSSILTLVVQYVLFNYFHFDGFVDTVDAFLSKKGKEDILKAMEDTHVGAFAVLFGSIYVFLKIFAYMSVISKKPEFLIASFSTGRISMVLFPSLFVRYAKSKGLGYIFVINARKGLLTSLLLLAFILSLGFPQTMCALIVCFAFSLYFIARIGGFTGDTLGFICELSELLWLLVAHELYFRD